MFRGISGFKLFSMTTYKFDVWTNLAYIIAGLYGVYFTESTIASMAVIFLGIGSFHGHYTRDFWLDWWAMWIAFSAVISTFLFEDPLIQVFFTVSVGSLLRQLELWLRGVSFRIFGLPDHYLLLGTVYIIGFILSFWHGPVYQSLIYGSLFLVSIHHTTNRSSKKNCLSIRAFS